MGRSGGDRSAQGCLGLSRNAWVPQELWTQVLVSVFWDSWGGLGVVSVVLG